MRWTFALLLVGAAAPAIAQDDPLAPILTDLPPPKPVVPLAVVPKDWRGVFAAIRAEDWVDARAGIEALGDHPLKPVAKAELFTAKNSPKADLSAILALLGEAPELPQAVQLQRMAVARGAVDTPSIVTPARVVPLTSAPRRHRSTPVRGEPAADALRSAMEPLVKADLAVDAEALYAAAAPTLSPEARAEAAQRVAWIYYVTGLDADARRVAESGIEGATGEWGSQAHWIAGLAAWRASDCEGAAVHFRAVAYGRSEPELAAAGAYWAARSEMACRRPQLVEPLMKAAAKSAESFYGLVARETLGMAKTLPPTPRAPAAIGALPNVRRAIELAAIGERSLAEEMLRHQCRIGSPSSHSALAAKARELDLPAAAFWIAHNGPMGAVAAPADRFPLPRWAPSGGWRVDPALAYAHVRQESDFRMAAVSPAGAVGLMQVRPGTAGDFARSRGVMVGNLADPVVNLEYGQSFIELMRGKSATRGQLPRVIAAFNAGPVPVDRWNSINDKGDPLLWIESLPYWETRYYVPAVLRNMWVYEGMAGTPQTTLISIAQHKWPAFPVARGATRSIIRQ
ncbi:lytic transglycosylase domain-containing protein [Sphingomonas sp.]|uniref:lytic transglycosylase domain-containing protein n=1 Tax=Sphingomonas sp. TaxID=28214 RepID=UPI00286CF3D9|nr:lytic transglycosylase domain-containing protein [Sphingomonas sp.]